MLKGVLFGVFLAVFITSIALVYMSYSGLLTENLVTGAVIGTTGIGSYAIITAIISVGVIVFLYLLLKKPHSQKIDF